MKIDGKKVLLCSCEETLPVQAKKLVKVFDADQPDIHNQLCRVHLGSYEDALDKNQQVIVACTQEAPLFEEIKGLSGKSAEVSYVNIRERAGWGNEGKQATPKIAALLAEAALDGPGVKTVSMASEGRVLVYGKDETAIEMADKLADRMDVTLILEKGTQAYPPAITNIALLGGTVAKVSGHFGAYEVTVQGLVATRPSAKTNIAFEERGKNTVIPCDIFVDLSGGTAFIPSPDKRDGYYHLDPKAQTKILESILEIGDLSGEFDKPRYVDYEANICAHSRNSITGCSKCIDQCETSAISSVGEKVAIYPYICAGCGDCSGACPTGAINYMMPGATHLLNRLRVVLSTYRKAGGAQAEILVHDADKGAEIINLIGRGEAGLPAQTIPFTVNRTSQIGLDFLTAAIAYGASSVKLLTPPSSYQDLSGLEEQIALCNQIVSSLGYEDLDVSLVREEDPDAVRAQLGNNKTKSIKTPASFMLMDTKRGRTLSTLRHLQAQAPVKNDRIELPQGAPFGAVEVNATACTLCLSCVGACPTGALADNPDSPLLKFTEEKCVQCGLCTRTCPEKVMQLSPGLNFDPQASQPVVLKEEDPFNCISCGKPFGTRGTIEKMVDKLADHPMFKDPERLARIKMCDDCRVIAEAGDANSPLAMGSRPKVRTTDDYLQ